MGTQRPETASPPLHPVRGLPRSWMLLPLLAWVAGCAAPAPRPPDLESVRLHDGRTREPTEVARSVERDIQQFLGRREAGSRAPEPSAPTTLVKSTAPPVIHWNDAGYMAQPGGRSATDPGPRSAGQSPVARPADTAPRPARRPIDWAGQATDPAAPSEDAGAIPVPGSGGSSLARAESDESLEMILVDLCRALYQDAAYADMPLRQLLLIAATTLVNPDRQLAPEAIPDLTDRERQVLGEFQRFFVHLGEGLSGSPSPAEVQQRIDEALQSLRQSLRTEPQLHLPTTALCTRVDNFGKFTEIPRNEDGRYVFLAHTERKVIVYLEMTDFASQLNSRGEWVTELSQELRIYSDRDGIPVWSRDWMTAADLSKNKRADFFTTQVITLPKELSVGRYQLKIRVRDEQSGAEAETALELEMVADPNLAVSGS